MIDLPPTLTRPFRDAAGRVDLRALVRSSDGCLVALARELTPNERARLYLHLRTLHIGFVDALAATAAGFDIEAERRRLMWLLEVADEAELAATGG